MDLSSTRQKLVASNIANVDTPGYKTKDIDFQFEFMSLTQGGEPQRGGDARVWWLKTTATTSSLDREARLLAENAMRFNLASSLMKTQLKLINSMPSRRASPDESFFGTLGERFGDGGAANARRTAGGESGELGNHAHSRGGPYRRKDAVFTSAPQTSPFSAVFQTEMGSGVNGVQVSDVIEDTASRKSATCPAIPTPIKDGYVAFPRINPAEDMVDLMSAAQCYKATWRP